MEPQKKGCEETLRALGICAKAGKLVFGTAMICEALKKHGKTFLVLCADDNSENTKKRLQDRCSFYGVPVKTLSVGGDALADATGRTGRIAAVALTDENLCRLVTGTMKE